MGKKKSTDLNHCFPTFEQFSRLVPGEERIRENVLVNKPIEVPPDGVVTTVYEALKKAAATTSNGEFLGEIVDGKYQWKTYSTVIYEAQVIGSALVHLGLQPGEATRVGIAGIHSVKYMTALHALVSYSMVLVPLYHNSKVDILCEIITNCNLELIFCDNDDRAEEFIKKKKEGILSNMKKIVVLNSVKKQVNGYVEGTDDLEVYSYEHIYTIGEANLKPVFPPSPKSVYIICHTSGTTGRPKGVQLTHRSLLAAMSGLYIQWVPPPNRFTFDKNDVYFSFLSLAHIYEHLMQTFTIYVGGRVGIYSGDVTKLVTDIQTLRPTILSLVPRLLNKFHDHIHAEISKKNVLAKKLFMVAKEVCLTTNTITHNFLFFISF